MRRSKGYQLSLLRRVNPELAPVSRLWIRFLLVMSCGAVAIGAQAANARLGNLSVEQAAEADTPVEEILVTGSRIKRSDANSASPLTIISGESILQSGFSNLGDALRDQAVAGTGGFNQSGILSGGGATSVDLRNLGQSRVLILINGKRVASFADALANQAVDLSFVPVAMVERVEILRDGASAIYGSDAISGVVNVILRERFSGIRAGSSSGISSEGDGQLITADFAWGATSDRGSILIGSEYRNVNNINQADRDWALPTVSNLTGGGVVQGSFFSPGGVFFERGFFPTFCTIPRAFGGDEVTNDLANCPSLQTQNPTAPEQVQLLSYDAAAEQDLIVESELYTLAGYGVYDLTPTTELFFEAQFSRRQSTSNLDADPGSFGTNAFPLGTRIPATNPNLPAGSFGGSFFFRPTSTIGTRRSEFEVDTLRLVGGLRGEILRDDSFFNNWNWELSYLFTDVRSDSDTRSSWNLARFLTIVDPAACAADIDCAAAVNASGALDAIRPGNWTADEINYLRHNPSTRSDFATQGFFGLLTGPLVELPAGEMQLAVGFETRDDRGTNTPDAVTQSGQANTNQIFATRGSYDVQEVFAELKIPLLADRAFAQLLEFDAQIRYSDFSSFGTETVDRLALNWQIVPDLRIRATKSTAYRAPQITDLFGGGVTTFDQFSHPCSNQLGERTVANVEQNCQIDGIFLPFRQANPQFAVLGGGNENLEPESADTSTVGIVLTPRFLDGFTLTLDYWDIEVRDLIGRATSDSIVDSCYFGPVGLTAPECSQFDTTLTGAGLVVSNLVNRLENLNDVSTDGFDLHATYEFDGPLDTLVNLDLQGTYVKENTFFPGAGGADDQGSNPRIRANFNANVSMDAWNFTWRVRYIHSMSDPTFDERTNVFGYEEVTSHTEHDLRVGYNWTRYSASLGVNDVFDKDPPYVFSPANNTDLSLYSPLGRYIFLRLSANL